jgi:hypothetical protein
LIVLHENTNLEIMSSYEQNGRRKKIPPFHVLDEMMTAKFERPPAPRSYEELVDRLQKTQLVVSQDLRYLTQFQVVEGCNSNFSEERMLLKDAKVYQSYRCFPADKAELYWIRNNVTIPKDHQHLIPDPPIAVDVDTSAQTKTFAREYKGFGGRPHGLTFDRHRRFDQLQVYLWIHGISNRRPRPSNMHNVECCEAKGTTGNVNDKLGAALPKMMEGIDYGFVSCGTEEGNVLSSNCSLMELGMDVAADLKENIPEETAWLPVQQPDFSNWFVEGQLMEPDGENGEAYNLNKVCSSKADKNPPYNWTITEEQINRINNIFLLLIMLSVGGDFAESHAPDFTVD